MAHGVELGVRLDEFGELDGVAGFTGESEEGVVV